MLDGLIDIYDSWKVQLDKIGQPYYLKIWLYEPRFSKSQVVCAVGDRISYYENIFQRSDDGSRLETEHFGSIKEKLKKLNWEYRLDEDHFDNNEIGEPESYLSLNDFKESKKWFERVLKNRTGQPELMRRQNFTHSNVAVFGLAAGIKCNETSSPVWRV